jgi:hypothetical protein
VTVGAWPEPPTAGDIVWCHFPAGVRARPKPRPALVLDVFGAAVPFAVRVAYGTSQGVRELHGGEFAILRTNHPAAFSLANLSYDTKFDLRQLVTLPYTSQWFSVPPHAPHGQSLRLGTLHPSLVRAAAAAFRAAALQSSTR